MMNNEERKHRYEMMGVVSYVQEMVIAYDKKHEKLPAIAILGKLEWEILEATLDEDFSIAGIPCVPDLTKQQGVWLS
jgi:hypothetical protein